MTTPSMTRVVKLLKKLEVSTVEEVGSRLELSRPTIFRALGRQGYFSSLNHNARYVTLAETPVFDPDGLWGWNGVRFSRHGPLKETIVELVRRANVGLTAQELQFRVGTRVHNQVSVLCRDRRLLSARFGHTAVYTSAQEQRASGQRRARLQQVRAVITAPIEVDRDGQLLPEGLSAAEVIALLIEMIERPLARPAGLARALRRRGFTTTADTIRAVLEFYRLEKKRVQWTLPDL